ncbi:MAG: glycoside hydrolase family 16 protein [Aeromicrobium sp.]
MHSSVKRLAALSVSALAWASLFAAPASAWTPRPTSACGSAVVTKSDGTTWKCTFGDDFTGGNLDTSKWGVQTTAGTGSHTGVDCLVNSSKNVSTSFGVLRLTTRKESAPFTCTSPYGNFRTQYTGAMVSTYNKFAQAYGRFEIRAKFPATKVAGLQSALWLYPQNPTYGSWPQSGEIDIAEEYSAYADRAVPYIHYAQTNLTDASVTNSHCLIKDVSAFHSYVAEWTPTNITIKYDGATCLSHSWTPAAPLLSPAPFDQPFMVCLTQGLGVNGNAFNSLTTPLPATTQVDYVRVWS